MERASCGVSILSNKVQRERTSRMAELIEIKGVGPVLAKACVRNGYGGVDQLAAAMPDELVVVPGISDAKAKLLIAAAQALLGEASSSNSEATPINASAEDTSLEAKDRKKKKKDKKKNKKKDKKKKKGKKKKSKKS
ncbi:MAG: helix-hairpin-helix domain-containing protein [Alphaproteobacteria bacterium]|nr:helix-hairpin-helix domain-containing protein [Alphaproteobacteria bacterium]